ncbi:Gfo/Idh/MocA family protein [Ferruginibacter sp.]|nr:Gfo/Idh/MocA family oxidoreductase [Ferruginibacter sp.]
MNRRFFLRNMGITALGSGLVAAVPMDILAAIRKRVDPSALIRVGLIGCKGMGWANLTSMLKISEVTCAALCDIDDSILAQRKADLEKINIKPQLYKDHRQLLDNKEIDVVIIASPDHWHCLHLTDACAAGKDALVEKPVANSITEASQMIKAVQQNNRIVQVNQWQRSQQHFKDAVAFVQSGQLGKIFFTKTWMHRSGSTALPILPDDVIPAGVDYERWLGPATQRPFNKNRFHYEFRWFWDYAGGLMTDWGVHLIDVALWAMKATMPTTIMSTGGKYAFAADARETPDTQSAVFQFNNFQLSWEHAMGMGSGYYGQNHGIAFMGENGTLVVSRSGWEVRPEKVKTIAKMEAVAWQPSGDNGVDKHMVNFIEAVKSRDALHLNCPIEAGAVVAKICHMGNIAYRTGEKLYWDDSKATFNNKKASKLITPSYQNGWRLPHL